MKCREYDSLVTRLHAVTIIYRLISSPFTESEPGLCVSISHMHLC